MRGYTGYPLGSSARKNPDFSRKQSSGRYNTSNAIYGSYLNQRPTSSSLKKSWAELSPVKRPPMNKTRPTSNTNRNPVRHTQGTVKSSIQGTVKSSVQGSTSVTASKAGKTTASQQTTVDTKPSHSAATSITTHQSTNNKATSYQPTGANRGTIGGYPTVVGNTKATSHQSADVTKSVITEDQYSSRIDQGKHHDNTSVLPTNQKATPLATITTTTAAATTTAVVSDAKSSGKNVTVGGSHSINSSNSKGNYNSLGPHNIFPNGDDYNKNDMKGSTSSTIGKHQEPPTSTTQGTLFDDKKLTGGGNHSGDRLSYYTRPSHDTGNTSDPYCRSTNISSTSNGGSSVGSGFSKYGRHDMGDTRVPSYSKKQLVRGLSNLGNTCFYNAVMQNLTVLVILYERLERIARSTEYRSYTIPGGDMNVEPLTVTVNTSSGHNSLTNKLYQFLNGYNTGNPNPASLLDGIGYKNTRFRGRSQQDSHELFRTLLDGIRTEEAELIRKAIDQKLGTAMDGETKLMKKVYRRNITTQIDEVFGGKMCSVVICRKCHHVSHITEPFLDLSLPIVDSQRGQSGQRNMRGDKQTTTLTGVCELLKKQGEGMPYPVTCKRSHDGVCSIENCLSDYTDIEVMDDDNMFICSECNKRHQEQRQHAGKGGDSEPILSPVSKLLLINKLPPVLVLHVKRFSIGYTITKSSKHVKFSLDLNMKKYCTEQCKDGFNYRLKGVVSHSGSLNFGHYIAYVCSDNQWYYASDSRVNTVTTDRVLGCEAYMLFYERTS